MGGVSMGEGPASIETCSCLVVSVESMHLLLLLLCMSSAVGVASMVDPTGCAPSAAGSSGVILEA